MNLKMLKDAYNKAIKLNLDKDFINYLEKEIKRREAHFIDPLNEIKEVEKQNAALKQRFTLPTLAMVHVK